MALEFILCTVPKAHLDTLAAQPGWVHDYLVGRRPSDLGDPGSLPSDWPQSPPERHDCWGANHRNVDLYHAILNGGPELVAGPGALFQTWYEPDHSNSAIVKLDARNERFGLAPEHLAELRDLAAGVDLPRVLQAFTEWCRRRGEPWEDLDQYACQPFVDEFQRLVRILDGAIARGEALVW